jgi:hypothetical protein
MDHRITRHLRANLVAYLALAVAIGGGSGYALAASRPTNTIHVCVDRTDAHVLHLQTRCHRGQRALTWNQAGRAGPQGPAGPPAATAWAIVAPSGAVIGGHGLSIRHVSPGDYQITVSAAGCTQALNAPVVSISDADPPNGQSAGTYPVAWVGDGAGVQQFTVSTGLLVNGTFTPTDDSFNVQDACS